MNAADRRKWGLAIGWLGTTALAVGLALAAVGVVSDSVTENRPEPLSAAAVSAALAEGAAPGAEAPTATTGPPSDPAPTSPTTQPPPATTSPTTRQTSPPATTKPSTPAPSTATTATTTPTPSTSPTTVPDDNGVAAQPEERTYEMVGGTVRVRFAGGKAELLSATPRAGFRVERTSGNPNEVRVTFRSDDHESRFRAWWDGGPKDQIDEKRR